MFHCPESIKPDRSIESDLGLNFKKPVAALFVASSQRVKKTPSRARADPSPASPVLRVHQFRRSTTPPYLGLCVCAIKKTVPRAKRRTVTSQMSCIESTAGAGGQIVNCLWSDRVQFERVVI